MDEKSVNTVGDSINAGNASWTFSGEVVNTFEDHISKSVPFYNQGHDLICQLSDFFIRLIHIATSLGLLQVYYHTSWLTMLVTKG